MNEEILFQSQRLYVRTWLPSDPDTWYQVMSHPQTHLYTGEEPWSRDKTIAHLHWLLDHHIGWQSGTFNCPLILRATNCLIGHLGLNPFLEDEHIPEIEWTISPKHWGQGDATEIGRAMLAYGFQQAAFPAIMGFALPQHLISKRVIEKIGMTYLNNKAHQGAVHSFYRIQQHDFTD